jgi:hypothetical protein
VGTSDSGPHNSAVASKALREEEFEARWEAAPAILLVIAFQILLAIVSQMQHWKLWDLPWWVWLIAVPFEVGLLVSLAWGRSRRQLQQRGIRRTFALALLALISLANALLLVAVLASLVRGTEKSGAQLLLKAMTLWGTNVLTYGLWFWEVDRGGPVRRLHRDAPLPDFQFPQMENPQLAVPGWQPELLDYVYVSATNAIAFSPTDAMPLSRRAKLMMLSESVISSLTVLLVAARAVNIFK